MKFVIALMLVVVLVNPSHAGKGFFESVGSSIMNICNVIAGAIEIALKNMPSMKEIIEKVKNLFLGYPANFVSTVVNEFCSNFLISTFLDWRISPDIGQINFQLRTACTNFSVPLRKAEKLWKHEDFDPNKKVVILASGWLNTIYESDVILVLAKAYNCRGDVNFVAVDIANLANTFYIWAALNTEITGQFIANGLVELSKIVPVENIHLIGHSLGAHIMSAAAREFTYKTGAKIPRITGLDPAKPCFNQGESLSGLYRGDAVFVDIIHSNPGVFGKRDAIGDVDFYPDGLNPLPPGCFTNTCAHSRAWEYYAESVYPENEHNFKGVRCRSMTDMLAGKCPGKKAIMGFAVEHTLVGSYFLIINSESPYGFDAKNGNSYLTDECGKCGGHMKDKQSKAKRNKRDIKSRKRKLITSKRTEINSILV